MMANRLQCRSHERGFSLVTAVFLIVVLALLGVMIVTIGGMERATATTAAQGTRAYYAARSGIEWGIFEALQTPPNCGSPSPFTLSDPGLDGFSVAVTCTQTQHVEHNDYPPGENVYVITATATYGNFGDSDFVQRTLLVSVTSAQGP